MAAEPQRDSPGQLAFLFDLDGTLIDSVYQHVLAWSEALQEVGLSLSVWKLHRRIGMSGGLFVNALARELGDGWTRRRSRGCPSCTPTPTSAIRHASRRCPGPASCSRR